MGQQFIHCLVRAPCLFGIALVNRDSVATTLHYMGHSVDSDGKGMHITVGVSAAARDHITWVMRWYAIRESFLEWRNKECEIAAVIHDNLELNS